MVKLFALGLMLMLAGGLALLLPLLTTTPVGPLLTLLAILGQRRPVPRPALVPAGLITMSDRAYLVYLLTREANHG